MNFFEFFWWKSLWVMLKRSVQFFESYWKKKFSSLYRIFEKSSILWVVFLTKKIKKSILWVTLKKKSIRVMLNKCSILWIIFWEKRVPFFEFFFWKKSHIKKGFDFLSHMQKKGWLILSGKMTQRIEPFVFFFFSTMTQRIELFVNDSLDWASLMNLFSIRVELLFLSDSKNWTFFEYDSKSWIFWAWLKE